MLPCYFQQDFESFVDDEDDDEDKNDSDDNSILLVRILSYKEECVCVNLIVAYQISFSFQCLWWLV